MKFAISQREELVLLALYNKRNQALKGCEINDALRASSGIENKKYFRGSTLYPLLNRLEEKGFVTSKEPSPGEFNSSGSNHFKWYSLTEEGKNYLSKNQIFRHNLLNWAPPVK